MRRIEDAEADGPLELPAIWLASLLHVPATISLLERVATLRCGRCDDFDCLFHAD